MHKLLMKNMLKIWYNVSKGLYDIFATYLLITVVYIAFMSLGLHAVFELLANFLDYNNLDMMWAAVGDSMGIDPIGLRLVLFTFLQLAMLWLLATPLKLLSKTGEYVFDKLQVTYKKIIARVPSFKIFFGITFTCTITLLLLPFVVQPTLVSREFTWSNNIERLANLADGEATLALGESAIGFYRRFYAKPDVHKNKGIDERTFDEAGRADKTNDEGIYESIRPPSGTSPMMDRWDEIIWQAAKQDPKRFAQIKSFMRTESAGRQFAVSHTGCAGLMQFCSKTARNEPFVRIFGTGQVYKCGCSATRCAIPKSVRLDLERGDPQLLEKHKHIFPCEITDARFNASKAIHAGALYIAKLNAAFDGNMYLMYIGYNSGPSLARTLYKRLGSNSNATLQEIEVHLASVLSNTYKGRAPARARALIRNHLPKIQGTFQVYYEAAQATQAAQKGPHSEKQNTRIHALIKRRVYLK